MSGKTRLNLELEYRHKKRRISEKRLEIGQRLQAEGAISEVELLDLEEAFLDACHAEELARIDASQKDEGPCS